MIVLIVGNKQKESEDLYKNAQKASDGLKEIEVSFINEESDLYELPLVVINNIIVSSGTVLSVEELKEAFNNPPQGCSGSCGSCGGCA
ncbi:MAG: hypothetical protein PHG24_00095 [Candidatus Pacebacteria bacterium]|nr:hypothetical protein [Candidatus Paceibacterota bacterium]